MKFSHLNRIYTTKSLIKNQILRITGDNFHYLKSVIRLRKSESFRVFNSIDGEYLAKIVEIDRCELKIFVDSLLRPVEEEKELSLAICMIKPDRMIEAVKGAVCLGATNIVPIISERTQYKKLQKNRIERCIIQAIEQSERFVPTKLSPEVTLSNFYQNNDYRQIIAACESENINNKMVNIKKIEDNPVILIGPEGGFSDQEIDMIKSSKNTFTVSLGNSVLRTELAAISALACVSMIRN